MDLKLLVYYMWMIPHIHFQIYLLSSYMLWLNRIPSLYKSVTATLLNYLYALHSILHLSLFLHSILHLSLPRLLPRLLLFLHPLSPTPFYLCSWTMLNPLKTLHHNSEHFYKLWTLHLDYVLHLVQYKMVIQIFHHWVCRSKTMISLRILL